MDPAESKLVGAQPVIVLVGLPGSGKSTVGQRLAAELGVLFRDTDSDIEASTARTISDIFVESGEAHFRELEAVAVLEALAEHRGVLALGGGAVMNPETRKKLRSHVVAFLDVGLAAAMQRLEMNRSRPLLLGNIRSQWQALAEERRPLYLEVAKFTVQTDNRSVDEVVRAISTWLTEVSGVP